MQGSAKHRPKQKKAKTTRIGTATKSSGNKNHQGWYATKQARTSKNLGFGST